MRLVSFFAGGTETWKKGKIGLSFVSLGGSIVLSRPRLVQVSGLMCVSVKVLSEHHISSARRRSKIFYFNYNTLCDQPKMRTLSPATTHDDVTAGSRAKWLFDLDVFVPLMTSHFVE